MTPYYKGSLIIVTGAFGFVGSNLLRLLNSKGIAPYVIEHKTSIGEKWRNVAGLSFTLVDEIPSYSPVTIVALGANVNTTEIMNPQLWENNVDGVLKMWKSRQGAGLMTRLIYASSASVYGKQETDCVESLDVKPMNAYAFTKLQLDCALNGEHNVFGLRFFNVWGPNEGHKGNMKSVVARAMDITNGVFEIFKTGREDIPDGEQARDFVFVEDVASVIWHFITTEDSQGGLFNVGSGRATSFNEIADALKLEKKYIEMPQAVKGQYQYRTCADLAKLRAAGYTQPFVTVAEGIAKMRERNKST